MQSEFFQFLSNFFLEIYVVPKIIPESVNAVIGAR